MSKKSVNEIDHIQMGVQTQIVILTEDKNLYFLSGGCSDTKFSEMIIKVLKFSFRENVFAA